MVHYPNALATTEMLREIMHETAGDFPYIALESDLLMFADRCSSWHWHDYFEFAVVMEGVMEVRTQSETCRLSAGEGYFMNANILHTNRVADGSEHALIHVQQFSRSLLTSSGSIMQRYVQPMESCGALTCLSLTPGNPEHLRILSLISESFSAAENEPEGYELTVSACILQAWQALFGIAAPILESASPVAGADASRIKQMLSYIHSHAAEPITAPMIAAAANVCTREAFRCFRKVLGTTPVAYLTRHRVNIAARMLIESDRSVTDIASACGFSTSSYFCKVFSNAIGQSPRDFRKRPFEPTID